MRDGAPSGERQAEREQRRAELRNALQPNRQLDAQRVSGNAPVPSGRQLSALELAEMRQQLRQPQTQSRRPGS